MPDVLMPRLSDSMEEGTIIRWLRSDGDEVARGDEIVEIETDKATMAYEADDAGVLWIVAAEGTTVPVGAVIATVGAVSAPAPAALVTAADARVGTAPVAAGGPPRRNALGASPVARRTAQRLGVGLGDVTGSGPYGRILKADVVAAANAGANGGGAVAVSAAAPIPETATPAPTPATPAPQAKPRDTAGAKGAVTVEELSRLQQTVASRMAASKATIPDFALDVDVDMSAVLALRAELKELGADPMPSINDVLVKLVAVALKRAPRVNGAYRDGRFERYERVNVGVAVAAEDALVVPTVFDADRMSLGTIAAETRRLAGRVREGVITPPELTGGTFTVSNLGMFGVDRFAGVINPPQAAILCVGAIAQRPAVDDSGAIVARPMATLTVVSDHRILYGADAARFLADVRGALETPLIALL